MVTWSRWTYRFQHCTKLIRTLLSRRSKHCIRKECRDKPCSTTVFFAGWWVLHPGFRFLKVLSLETTYRASTPVSSPEQCSTWPCAKPRQRLFRLFCKQAVQHYCPECASQLCTVPSHMPSYLFTRSCIIRHVPFRFLRFSQNSHGKICLFALRQQSQLAPQCP